MKEKSKNEYVIRNLCLASYAVSMLDIAIFINCHKSFIGDLCSGDFY